MLKNIRLHITNHLSSLFLQDVSHDEGNFQALVKLENEFGPQSDSLHTPSNQDILMPSNNVRGQYNCHICAYFTNKSANLNRHMAAHFGKRPYVCIHCNRGFSQKAHLQSHVLTHVPYSDRPHKCSTCGKAFTQKHQLLLHSQKHYPSQDGQYV